MAANKNKPFKPVVIVNDGLRYQDLPTGGRTNETIALLDGKTIFSDMPTSNFYHRATAHGFIAHCRRYNYKGQWGHLVWFELRDDGTKDTPEDS